MRRVLIAKRDATIYDKMGDKTQFEKAAWKVKQKAAAYDSFIAESGLSKSVYRTQVEGYNRSVAAKATAASAKRQGAVEKETAKVEKAVTKNELVVFSNGKDANTYFAKQSADLIEDTKAAMAFNYWSNEGSPAINSLLRGRPKAVIEDEVGRATQAAKQMRRYISKKTLDDDIRVKQKTLTHFSKLNNLSIVKSKTVLLFTFLKRNRKKRNKCVIASISGRETVKAWYASAAGSA